MSLRPSQFSLLQPCRDLTLTVIQYGQRLYVPKMMNRSSRILLQKQSQIFKHYKSRDGQTGSARIWCTVEPGGAHMRVIFQPACLVTSFHVPIVRCSPLSKDNILCILINRDVGAVVTEVAYIMSIKYIMLDALPKLGSRPSGTGGSAGNSISLVAPEESLHEYLSTRSIIRSFVFPIIAASRRWRRIWIAYAFPQSGMTVRRKKRSASFTGCGVKKSCPNVDVNRLIPNNRTKFVPCKMARPESIYPGSLLSQTFKLRIPCQRGYSTITKTISPV